MEDITVKDEELYPDPNATEDVDNLNNIIPSQNLTEAYNQHLQQNQPHQEPEGQTVHIRDKKVRNIQVPTKQIIQPTTNQQKTEDHQHNKEAQNIKVGPNTTSTTNNNPTSLLEHTRTEHITPPFSRHEKHEKSLPKIHFHQLPSLPLLMLQILRRTLKANPQNIKRIETCHENSHLRYEVRFAPQLDTHNVPEDPNV